MVHWDHSYRVRLVIGKEETHPYLSPVKQWRFAKEKKKGEFFKVSERKTLDSLH
jgi:hypothetical protein